MKSCAYCTSEEVKRRCIIKNKYAWAFPTNTPVVFGHVLIAPLRCVAVFDSLTKKEKEAIFALRSKLKRALKNVFKAEGFNYAWNEGDIAGQSVHHFHLHMLPRRTRDTGVTRYEPRKFLYRPGARSPKKEGEMLRISEKIKKVI